MKREELRVRDPFVYVEDGVYYLLGTTGQACWDLGSDLTLYRSRDLKTFERVCTLVEEKHLAGYIQRWAPELHRYRGKYYLILSLFCKEKGRGSMIFVSESLCGPFVPLTGDYVTPAGWTCLDATLFVYRDTPYLCFSNEWVSPVTADGDGALYIAPLTEDLRSLAGEPKKIVSGKHCGFSVEIEDAGRRGYVAEGPFLADEGKIALYWSTFAKDGYCMAKSTAEEPMGDYRFERMIFEKDGGHGMIFTDLEGTRRVALHRPNLSPEERLAVFPLQTKTCP